MNQATSRTTNTDRRHRSVVFALLILTALPALGQLRAAGQASDVAGERFFAAPAMPLEEVCDPTGAGDTFAGGFMGYLASASGA